MYLFYDYEFKTEASKEKWKKFLDNIDEEIKLAYRGRNSITVFINFKKCFNITPCTLRHSKKIEHADLRKFALYLLVHYSEDTLDDIANDFDTSIDELKCIKLNQELHLEYAEKIKAFFEPLLEDYAQRIRSNYAFSEVMQEAIDELILLKNEG